MAKKEQFLLHLHPEQSVNIQIKKYDVVVKHNDIGISIDIYSANSDSFPVVEEQFYFDDLKEM